MAERLSPPEVPASLKNRLAAIDGLVQQHRKEVHALPEEHRELTIAKALFEHALAQQGESPTTEQVIAAIFRAHLSTLLQLKSVINPTGLPLDVTPDGRIKSRTFRSSAVIATDIEQFTKMAFDVPRVGDTDIFNLLSYTYYPHLMEVLKKHHCHLYSFAGDGTMILSFEQRDEHGRVVLPALENAVLCVADASVVLSLVSQVWQEQKLHMPDGRPRRTRFGIKFGSVTMGDALAPDANPQGMCAAFNERFRQLVSEHAPYYGPPQDFSMRIWGVHGLGIIQNQAARLQTVLDEHPEHVCVLMREDVEQLCPPLLKRFDPLGRHSLKGIEGEVDIYGLRPVPATDVVPIEQACRVYYELHETYH